MLKLTYNPISSLKESLFSLREKCLHAQTQFQVQDAALLKLIESNLDAILILTVEHQLVYLNEVASQIFKLSPEILNREIPVGFTVNLNEPVEILLERKDDRNAVVEVQASLIVWCDQYHILAVLRDKTISKRSQEFLRYLLHHDYFSDFFSCFSFENALKKAIALVEVQNNYMAVLYVDIDNFSEFNSHEAGRIIEETVILLKNAVRDVDFVTKVNNGQFALVLSSLKKPSFAEFVAHKILRVLSEPLLFHAREIHLSINIGIAVYPTAGTNPIVLLKNAGLAAFRARKQSIGRYCYY